MSDLTIKCPNCSANIRIDQPSMPFIMQGKGSKIEFHCSTCGHTQGHTGKCDTCSRKSWGIA